MMGSGARKPMLLLAVGMVLVAANLRPAASSVGPLLDRIRDDLGLSSAAAGALTTLPVLCFGLVAPLGPALGRRIGYQAAVGCALVELVAGLLLRLVPGIAPLYLGTTLAGAAIAIGNVLLPVLVKRSFHERAGAMTGVYTTALIASAALAASVSVPLANAFGDSWRAALGFWAAPAAIGLLAWLPQLRDHERDAGSTSPALPARALLRDPLAWQVTAYFGFQSCAFYIVLSWLPTIFQSHGIGRTTAGLLLGVSMIAGLPGALLLPGIAARAREQGRFALGCSVFVAAGLVGLLAAPTGAPWLWVALIGIGMQASFPLALILVVLRSRNVAETAALSTMMQGLGYLMAAAGPVAVGALHDATNSWAPAIVVMLGLLVFQALFGLAAGRDRKLSVAAEGVPA
jgi:CP family cyanate transporter-like MFS transporter